MTKAVAVIPARGGSKRLPRKNIADFMGKPMLAWPVEAALKSGVFSDVMVSSEDGEIGAVAEKYGALFIRRPPELATDEVDELDAYRHVIDLLTEDKKRPDYFCGLYATAVFLQPEDFVQSLRAMEVAPRPDVVMGVSGYPVHPYKSLIMNEIGYLQPMFPVENEWCSQRYPKAVASNGTFYWFRTESFLRNQTYYPERLSGYELPLERAVDIDTPEDYERAQQIARIILGKG